VNVNDTVSTPLGDGIVQGIFAPNHEVMVRLPINKATTAHLKSSLTPRAALSGIWTFPPSQVTVTGHAPVVRQMKRKR
jgi:hypothetical protein